LFNKAPKWSQPIIPPIKVPNNDNSNAEYTIMVGGDLWKEVSGIETNSKRALGCGRLFVKTVALIKQYLK